MDGRSEGMMLREALALSGVPHEYNLVTDVDTFEKSIKYEYYGTWVKNRTAPILHLSMHGDRNGVYLTNKIFVSWFDLNKYLNPINNASNGGLLICMSTCEGLGGIRMAMNTETIKPFWALVGNSKSVTWPDAAIGYSVFYHHIFKQSTIDKAVEAMKTASGNSDFMLFAGDTVRQGWYDHILKQSGANMNQASIYSLLGLAGNTLTSQ